MRVFVTGGSGHVGSALIPELQSAGHQVIALARSDASAQKLEAAGADVRHGDLDDLDVIKKAAADSDGVIHLAYRRDLMHAGDAAGVIAANLKVLEAAGETLEGTGKPFVAPAGTLVLWCSGRAASRTVRARKTKSSRAARWPARRTLPSRWRSGAFASRWSACLPWCTAPWTRRGSRPP